MKTLCGVFTFLLTAAPLLAQTHPSARLALMAESDDAAPVVDVLTAALSSNNKIQLLERDEIEKVYHEQGISAANRDNLKLGRILGADGLLLLNVAPIPQTAGSAASFGSPKENLTIRLIAVKPGVILTEGSFSWPPKDTVQWAASATTYLSLFLPKLMVSAKDAIPISVVNLRSAIDSADELEMERQLKLLTIQRLSQEPQFFVLEREKMQLLGEEKSLKSDESAFWDGSYLLDGIVDQNGYSKETININARLIPPKGGAPLLFEVSGSRTNLAEVINSLADKVAELLKVNSSLKEWSAASEASQYFIEANWALKWGVYSEAEASADSAWALGKRDLACALIRVQSEIDEIPSVEGTNEGHFRSLADYASGKADPHYVHINDPPNPENVDRALYALEAYYEFSRTSPDGEPKVLSPGHGNDWQSSSWYQLGVETLVAASGVLQHYCFNPQSQPPVADKLSDLRTLARSVANLILQSPSVHNSYFVGDRIAPHDELSRTLQENPNIFNCEVNWSCFWQERPEDAISLYYNLMSSPVFCYIHEDFWDRKPIQPRLIAWDEEDWKGIPLLWKTFMQELNNSTNVFLNMEARAIMFADASNDAEMAVAFTNLFNGIFDNHDAFVANNVEVLYSDWGTVSLVSARTGNGIVSDTKTSLNHLFYSEYFPRLEAMDQEYWSTTFRGNTPQAYLTAFEKQKQYLRENKPFDSGQAAQAFVQLFLFGFKDYSKSQALEIKSLLAAYRSNLLAQVDELPIRKKGWAKIGVMQLDQIEANVNQILSAPMPASGNAAVVQHVQVSPPSAVQPEVPAKKSVPPAEIPTNILSVIHFIKVPDQKESNDITANQTFAQRWSEGKLLFGLAHDKEVDDFDTNGNWIDTREASVSKIAIFNPTNKAWTFVNCSEINHSSMMFNFQDFDNRIVLFHGDLFSSLDGPLKKYDFQKQEWLTLDVPEQDGCDLFGVAGHLYAVSADAIFELANDGSTRILASTRRRPAVTILDSLDNIGFPSSFAGGSPDAPELFSGQDQSLCASIGEKIYSWDGNDWHDILTMNTSRQPEIFEDAIIFRSTADQGRGEPLNLWIWDKSPAPPELCLSDKPKAMPQRAMFYRSAGGQSSPMLHPFWKSLPQDFLTQSSATFYNSDLYFFVNHVTVTNINGYWTAVEKDGYHAKLVCLCRDSIQPIVIPLKFDTTRGQLPLQIGPGMTFKSSILDTTMYFSGNTLYLSHRTAPGIWTIPVSELELAIAAQKQSLLKQIAQAKTTQEKAQNVLIAKYDLNHNGIIDPDERETALADTAFIESELDKIDSNHDGWLEADELAYFDANHNGILDPNEQAGIEIAQHLLAVRLMNKFDAEGKGFLTRFQFDDLKQSCTGGHPRMPNRPPFFGIQPGEQVRHQDVEDFLKQQTRKSIRLPGAAMAVANEARMSSGAFDPQQSFKWELEYYWKNSRSHSH